VPDREAVEINERFVAVYARHRDKTVLLGADMGESGLRQLAASGVPDDISLLKIPHHGSRYAAPELFLEQFAPATAFVSAGRDSTYGFPHVKTVEACTRSQIPLDRTDRMGMLRFHVQDGEWQRPHAPRKGFRID